MMQCRELLMRPKTLNESKLTDRYVVSEKLDGFRVFWDGGISRYMNVANVPYANKLKLKMNTRATGLWSRYGKPVYASDKFLEALPQGIMLEGELYWDRGKFQETMSIARRKDPDLRWSLLTFQCFDVVPLEAFSVPGRVKGVGNTRYEMEDSYEWLIKRGVAPVRNLAWGDRITTVSENDILKVIEHKPLTDLTTALSEVEAVGGEGLVVRNPDGVWTPHNTDSVMKIKRSLDAEAVVVGCIPAVGDHEGLIGGITVKWDGKTFDIGPGCLTHEQRKLPGLSPGTIVTFKYQDLTNAGIPRHGRFYRLYKDIT